MDLRIEKSEKAIRNAFLELRSKKPLEKITVKELCALSMINKSTFYSHYQDIFDLSDTLENEVIESILDSLSPEQQYIPGHPEAFTRGLCFAFMSHYSLTATLFSGREQSRLTTMLEKGIKERIFEKYPAYRDDTTQNIVLSYCIQGAYYAFINNRDTDIETVIDVICNVNNAIGKLAE
ncbi:MAG: TetR/AcrR family transcriptional regulator [Schaedlerella sp.]|nr:TetR/AcrR family transcriptional regulator [Lachnospiraceae bacterium]MDY4202887.1 TetR/AcrR family transcriptional regulator [Schaedlerella sp.]